MKILLKIWRREYLNLNSKGANQAILNEMKSLTESKIIAIFRHFCKELKISLNLT